MKNLPLALKIWVVFAAITLCIFGALAVLLPWTLNGFFTEQVYNILKDSQKVLPFEKSKISVSAIPDSFPPPSSDKIRFIGPDGQDAKPLQTELSPTLRLSMPFKAPVDGPDIQHIFLFNGEEVSSVSQPGLPMPFAQAIEDDAGKQQEVLQQYSRAIEDKTLFYVIRKEQVEGIPGFMVSYSWGNYRNDLVLTMFWRLMLLMVLLIVMSWVPCLWLARYLSRPLVLMEQQVGRMAAREWHEPFGLDRKDEMGRLAQAFESMRQRLMRQDKAQQFYLQNISHELKTPVMVIRSYAQSILDGIFPKGTLSSSIETIMKESDRLEKRIRDLLYLNKLNYLSTREKKFESFEVTAVLHECVERLRYHRPELDWTLDLQPMSLVGDPEQWGVALENVLDNQLRYAKKRISVTVVNVPSVVTAASNVAAVKALRIWNDGPPLDKIAKASLFQTFHKGANGQFGLGLAIVQQIMDYHQARIWAENEQDGVAFYIQPSCSS